MRSEKRRVGKSRKYATPEECIRVNSEKQKVEKRCVTQFKQNF